MSRFFPFTVEQELEIRRQVRAALAGVVPPEHVDPVTDLAVHGAQEALRALERVCDSSADPRHYLAAIGPAIGLLAGRCHQLEDAVRAYAGARNLPYSLGAVRFGGAAESAG